jgi:hypothetical protein
VTIVWLPAGTQAAGARRAAAVADREPGRRASAPPDRRPGAAGRTGQAAWLAHGVARVPGRGPGPGGRAGGAGRHAARPQHPGRADDLSTVASHRSMGVACPSGRAVRFVPPACHYHRQPRPPNVSMLPGPAHPGRPRWQRPGQPSRADSAARQPRTSGPGAGAEPALGDGNDDQGDEDQQPVAAEWSLHGPPLTARWAWGLPCRCRCAPSRSRGIRGTTGRLRRAGAASGGIGLCIARAWPSRPPWA